MQIPSEAEVLRDILLDAPRQGCRLLRNNIGQFEDRTGRWVRFGVGGNGGSDLIGWTELDGRAIFTVIEVKKPGWKANNAERRERLAEQQAFIDAVRAAGGIGAICYSVADFRDAIASARARVAA